jgi:hypothetical protein
MSKRVRRVKAVHKRRKSRLLAASHAAWLDAERLEGDTLRGSVLKRLAPAVQHLVRISPDQQLLDALSTNTGIDALIHLISGENAAAQVASSTEDPLREARARAAKRFSELLAAEGGPIGVDDASKSLRITRAAVDKRRKSGTLIGIEDGGRAILYPSWQFTPTGLLPGLQESLQAMAITDPWMRMQFFLTVDSELGERPLDALRGGRIGLAIAAAKRYGRLGEDG